jgi:hypothetical protein
VGGRHPAVSAGSSAGPRRPDYARGAGAGLTELVARFDDGTIVELAEEAP